MKSYQNLTIIVLALFVVSFMLERLSPKFTPISGVLTSQEIRLWQDASNLVDQKTFIPGSVISLEEVDAEVTIWRDFKTNSDFVVGLHDCFRLERNGQIVVDLSRERIKRKELYSRMLPATPEEESESWMLYRHENGDRLVFSLGSGGFAKTFSLAPSEESAKDYSFTSFEGESVQTNDPRLSRR